MTEALKPCPFCGAQPAFYAHPERDDDAHWVVTCQMCDMLPDQCWCVPKEQAIAAWNTRIQTEGASGLREVLEEARAALEYARQILPDDAPTQFIVNAIEALDRVRG